MIHDIISEFIKKLDRTLNMHYQLEIHSLGTCKTISIGNVCI